MRPSTPDLNRLTLHAVRLLGFGDTPQVASRFSLEQAAVEEVLGDAQAYGWVTRSEFAGTGGWSLTESGRVENERLLATELDALGARSTVSEVHRRFVPLNARFQDAATRWQLRPMPGDPLAANDHSDFRWDDRVIESLKSVGRRLVSIQGELAPGVGRFKGYAERYNAAMSRVDKGENRWVDGSGIDSCHVVWMQLHEDLLATLGLARGDGN